MPTTQVLKAPHHSRLNGASHGRPPEEQPADPNVDAPIAHNDRVPSEPPDEQPAGASSASPESHDSTPTPSTHDGHPVVVRRPRVWTIGDGVNVDAAYPDYNKQRWRSPGFADGVAAIEKRIIDRSNLVRAWEQWGAHHAADARTRMQTGKHDASDTAPTRAEPTPAPGTRDEHEQREPTHGERVSTRRIHWRDDVEVREVTVDSMRPLDNRPPTPPPRASPSPSTSQPASPTGRSKASPMSCFRW